MNCVVTTYWLLLEVVEVDQPDGDVLAVRAERHRPLAVSQAANSSFALTRPSLRTPMTIARSL